LSATTSFGEQHFPTAVHGINVYSTLPGEVIAASYVTRGLQWGAEFSRAVLAWWVVALLRSLLLVNRTRRSSSFG